MPKRRETFRLQRKKQNSKRLAFLKNFSKKDLHSNKLFHILEASKANQIQNGELIQSRLVGAWQPLCQDVVFRNGCCTVEKMRRLFFAATINSHVDKAISGGCAVR